MKVIDIWIKKINNLNNILTFNGNKDVVIIIKIIATWRE